MQTWVIGAGGLFGSALVRASAHPFIGPAIPWSDPARTLDALRGTADAFAQQGADRWCIAWAAGQATTSSTPAQTDRELDVFDQFLGYLQANPPPGQGSLLITSSAGGVYAGSSGPPFTSASIPQPLGSYGHLKLAQEQVATDRITSMPVV
ncbi:MAG TPA: hypothetical protein VIG24_17110, partial [Acidimicrobiia bacterium]